MPTEAQNTLRSRSKFTIVDIISQGPTKGIVNGAKSVFLNETPIQADDGSMNFPNFDISKDLRVLPFVAPTGSTTPVYPGSFPASENEVSVAVKVTKDSPEGGGSGDGSLTRTITDADLDAVRVTMRVPALTTTNTSTGDITGGKIQFQIYVKPNGGVFEASTTGSAWSALATPSTETTDGATGIELTTTVSGIAANAKNIQWQYRKKTAGVWGAWTTYATVAIPASSASSQSKGYWNWITNTDYTKSITGLVPGIYQVQAVIIGGTSTPTLARQFGASYIEIQGKTVSAYDADYLIPLPAGGAPWNIKVVRLSADNTAANYQDDLYWFSYTEIVDNRFSWPNIDGAQITIDAEAFGGNIPTRSYDYMGLLVQIPSNYDPYNRTYSGIWNGTFKTDWTDNPAWIFYDLLTNKRYGLGDNIDATQIDKFALYAIAQYCDELVTAPNGEVEPRYTCSCVINTQSEAYDLLTAIASAFRSMIYFAGGMITPVADMPSDPVLNVGPANVIDGNFTYQGASRKARHTVARVSWNNPDDGYKLNVELYEDTEAIRKYGYRAVDINAFGCTSRGLARRWGKWSVVSDNNSPDTVTYKAGFDHFKLRPGDVINIADPNYSGEQLFGLLSSVVDNVSPATHTITLDRAVTRLAGDTSELQLTLANGTILKLDVAVLSNTTSADITVDSVGLTTIPLVGASWLLKKGTVEPRQWRVIAVSEDEPNIYQVTAMLYDPNKYASIETGLNFAEADFTAFPSGPMPAPTGLAKSEFLKQTGSAILECVTLSWVRPADARADLFEAQFQEDGKDWQATTPNLTGVTSVDILNIVPGVYNFRVRAQDTSGLFRSEWTTLASQTLLGKKKAPENVSNFTATVEKFGILLKWTPVSDIDIDFYEIRSGISWAAGTAIGKPKAAEFKYEDATTGAYTFWIAAKDTSGNYSATPATIGATVSAQGAPTLAAVAVNGGIQLTISGTTTRGFKAYEIQRKEYPSGALTTINSNVLTKIFTDADITTLTYTKSWQYQVRALDQNGSASAYSTLTTQLTPKQIETNDITANQIIAKDFRTALNAGNGTVSGVLFNANGIQAWNGAVNTFCINAATGDVGITGTICATCGLIGGFTVSATEGLHAGCTTTRVQMKPGAGIWAGATAIGDAPFSVTNAGVLKAASGTIGGWSITADKICRTAADGSIFWIGNTSAPGNEAQIYIGALDGYNGISIGENPYVGSYGTNRIGINIRSNAANIFTVCSDCSGGNLLAQIAGWNFSATQLYSTGCGLILCNTGAIQTGDFVTSNKGWKIDSIGNAEFNNICARGAIRTAVFIKDEISVVGGCTMIRPAGVSVYDCNPSADCVNIYLNDSVDQFALNDLIRIKSDVNDYWGYVAGCSCNISGCFIYVIKTSGTRFEFTKGQAIVNYGSCLGCGGIVLNGQCPYIDLYTHAGLPWNGLDSRLRMGNLNGWGTFATDTYGIAIGATTETNRLTYDTASGKLKIYGDIEVMSSGNILPDAGMNGVLFSASSYSISTGVNVGEYLTTISGSAAIHGVWRSGACNAYLKSCSNGFLLGSDNNTSYSIAVSKSFIPVQCGATYTFSARVACHPGFATTRAYLCLCLYDSAMVAVAGCIMAPLNNTALTSTIPVRVSGTYTMPTNVAFVKVYALNYQPTTVSWWYLSGAQLELGSEATTWKCNQGGTITANMVKSGVLQSLNWNGTTLGSCISMNDGTFIFGGASAPKLSWNGTTLNVVGNITIAAGSCGIANLCDAGNLATVDNLDGVCNGATYFKTTANQVTGAGYGYNGLTTNGTIYGINRPDTRATNELPTWYGRGTFTEFKGSIAVGITGANTNGNLTTEKPWDDSSGGYVVQTYRDNAGVWQRRSALNHLSWQAWYKVTDTTGSLVSRVVPTQNAAPAGTGLHLGSDFMGFHNGTVWKTYMDNSGNFYLGGSAVGCGLAWNAGTNCLTVCGCVTACAGIIGGWNITCNTIWRQIPGISASAFMSFGGWCNSTTDYPGIFFAAESILGCTYVGMGLKVFNGAWLCKVGMVARVAGVNLFQVHANGDGTSLVANIAGWNFNAACLYNGNLILNSTGAISGCYSGTTTGWCINAAGDAVFNNATVRGTVCASVGCIGGFGITTACGLYTGAAATHIQMLAGTGIWMGADAFASAPFSVTPAGFMTAKSGDIGGLTIGPDYLEGFTYTDVDNYSQTAVYGENSAFTGMFIKKRVAGVTWSTVNLRAGRGDSIYESALSVVMATEDKYAIYTNALIYSGGTISGQTIVDRTEMPASLEEAKEIVNTMRPDGKGGIDYKRLSNKAKHFSMTGNKDKEGKEGEIEEGRDLTKTVSALVMVCQNLQEEVIRLQMRVEALEAATTKPTAEEQELIDAGEKIGEEVGETIRRAMK